MSGGTDLPTDRLTGLGNDDALTVWLDDRIVRSAPFWLALVDVDRFKALNDLRGYEAADDVLRQIAGVLSRACTADRAAFRPHGDEFFLVGADAADADETLQAVRREVRAAVGATVSVGWATSDDAGPGPLFARRMRALTEVALAAAKVERDRVVRYTPSLLRPAMRFARVDCAACRTRIELWVPTTDARSGALACPNCGAAIARPAALGERRSGYSAG